jgi:DNA polymerase-3 subunit beta
MEVSVETQDTPKATISTRGSIFNVIGMESKEFPPLPELEDKVQFEFDREELISMLKSVSYAQSVNEERYMLKGVFFQLNQGKLALVATDGRRLAVTKGDITTKDEGEFILPSLSVNEIEKLPKVGEKIKVSFTDRQVSFELQVDESGESSGFKNSIYLVSKVVEGKYPNYKQVIPKDDFNSAEIERELMQECVHRAALVSDEKVTLRIKKGVMEITGLSTLGDACESMSVNYEGEDSTVSFNPRFLLDPLRSIPQDKITLDFRDDMSPGVFKVEKPNEEVVFLCVVMPIRTD